MKKIIGILVFVFCCGALHLKAQVQDSLIFLRDSTTQAYTRDSIPQPSMRTSDSIAAVHKSDSLTRARLNKKRLYAGPRKATIMSAILPGLGQAYNKKYWKIPIIYAGLGGLGYMFAINNTQYRFYRKNLIAENDGNSNTVNTTLYSSDQLETQKLYYKKNRDFAVIGMALIYLFNVIDANVDAHLKTFDVSDDLSLSIDPWQDFYRASGSGFKTAAGLSFKLNFH